MSSLTYGGVTLQAVKLVNYLTEAVMAGNQYVCTKHSITVRGVYNPALNSYGFGTTPNNPQPQPGNFAPVTFAAIRSTLMQPRGQLVIEAAGFIMTVAPPLVRQAVNPTIPPALRTAQAAALAGGRAPVGAGNAPPLTADTPFGPQGGLGGGSLALQAVVGLLGAVGTAVGAVERSGGFQKFAVADVNNGPVAGAGVILEDLGDKTFFVQHTVICYLRETPPQKDNRQAVAASRIGGGVGDLDVTVGFAERTPAALGVSFGSRPQALSGPAGAPKFYQQSPLAAHEWDMQHRVDQDFFTTRTIAGRCVFRRDVLDANQIVPDQLRYFLGHPVPSGMRRQDVQVRQVSDGLTYTYQVIDRDRALRFDPNVFTRVEMSYTKSVSEKGFMDVMFGGSPLMGAVNLAAGFALRAGGVVVGQIRELLAGRQDFSSAIAAGFATLEASNFGLSRAIPVTSYHIVGRFWGHPLKDYDWLEAQANNFMVGKFYEALAIINPTFSAISPVTGRTFTVNSPVQLATLEKSVTRDESGKFLEFNWRVIGSLLSGAFNLTRPSLGGGRPGVLRPDPAPILANPMRGTYLGACVAQALRDPQDNWRQPLDPEWVQDSYDNSRIPARRLPQPAGPDRTIALPTGTVPGINP